MTENTTWAVCVGIVTLGIFGFLTLGKGCHQLDMQASVEGQKICADACPASYTYQQHSGTNCYCVGD